MNIDIKKVASEAVNTLDVNVQQGIGQSVEQLKGALAQALQTRESEMAELVNALKSGEMSEEEFQVELSREKLVIEAELLTEEIRAKAEIQKLVQGAFSMISGLVLKGL